MRPVPFALGLLTLAFAWAGPFGAGGHSAFYVHMTVHMSVVALAAPLIAIGLASYAPVLLSPVLASVLELAIVWLWHTPLLHHAARTHLLAYAAEQSSFLLSGLILWTSVFGGPPQTQSRRQAEGIIALLLTAMHMTLLGAIFVLSPRQLYDHAHSLASLSPLADQHLGGAIMLLAGGVSYTAGGLWLARGLIRTHR
jgi:putative membrane protein